MSTRTAFAVQLTAVGLVAALLMEQRGHVITGMNNRIVWGVPHVGAVFLIVAASTFPASRPAPESTGFDVSLHVMLTWTGPAGARRSPPCPAACSSAGTAGARACRPRHRWRRSLTLRMKKRRHD